MKIAVVNEERKVESVAPKILIYDTLDALNKDLQNLPDGAIVATKENNSQISVIEDLENKVAQQQAQIAELQAKLNSVESTANRLSPLLGKTYIWKAEMAVTANNLKLKITSDPRTGNQQGYGFLAMTSYHTSYGDSTHISLDLIRLSYTPYNGNEWRIITPYHIVGNCSPTFTWDTSGIWLQVAPANVYLCSTIIAPTDWRP